jgi:hypothetical protein
MRKITLIISAFFVFACVLLSGCDLLPLGGQDKVAQINIELPDMPLNLGNELLTQKIRIDRISYEIVDGSTISINFSGEKTYYIYGETNNVAFSFDWKLYDSQGYVVEAGTFVTKSLLLGEKFKDKCEIYGVELQENETYKFVILGTVPDEPEEPDVALVGVRIIIFTKIETVERFLAEWNDGDKTEDRMIFLMEEYKTFDTLEQPGYYEVSPGMLVDAIDFWCFDPARMIGDTEVISIEYGFAVCYMSKLPE